MGHDHDRVYGGIQATARTHGDSGDDCTSFSWIVYIAPKSLDIGDCDCVALKATATLTVEVRENVASESDTDLVALLMIAKFRKDYKAHPPTKDEKRHFVIKRFGTLEVLPLGAAMHQSHNLLRWCRSAISEIMRPENGVVKSNDILVLVYPFIVFLVEQANMILTTGVQTPRWQPHSTRNSSSLRLTVGVRGNEVMRVEIGEVGFMTLQRKRQRERCRIYQMELSHTDLSHLVMQPSVSYQPGTPRWSFVRTDGLHCCTSPNA